MPAMIQAEFEAHICQSRSPLQDGVAALDWSEMQDLVAGLLCALGDKARVLPAGPDQGKNIAAFLDGFGFVSPLIVVQVKHHKGTIGALDIRRFLGVRHQKGQGPQSLDRRLHQKPYEAERLSTNSSPNSSSTPTSSA